jgi:hypothetical protein
MRAFLWIAMQGLTNFSSGRKARAILSSGDHQ